MRLSTIVITNKLKITSPFLLRLSFSDEIVIVYDTKQSPIFPDNFDMTKIRLVCSEGITSFSSKRNLGLKKANGDWVLFVDDDEIVTKPLAAEIVKTIKESSIYSGYFLTRKDIVFGQVLNYGEVGKTRLLRLAKRSSGSFTRSVHECWKIDGKVSHLKEILYHQKDNFIFEFLTKIVSYGYLDSIELKIEKKDFSYFKLLGFPFLKFLNNYLAMGGIRDGYLGLFSAYLMSVQSLSVRVIQWEKKNI